MTSDIKHHTMQQSIKSEKLAPLPFPSPFLHQEDFYEKFRAYLVNTVDSDWCCDIVRSEDGANCLQGHLWRFVGDDARLANQLFDWFEYCYATTFMFYPVNDGTSADYPQSTPKARCIAYLDDLHHDRAETTEASMERHSREWLANGEGQSNPSSIIP